MAHLKVGRVPLSPEACYIVVLCLELPVQGLNYHSKSNVCGVHSPTATNTVLGLLNARAEALTQRSQNQPPPLPTSTPAKSGLDHARYVQRNDQNPSGNRPLPPGVPFESPDYRTMDPQRRVLFVEELREAEGRYGTLMREAERMAEPQRSTEIGKIKNRWNTKQCNTRKKYGISLRERAGGSSHVSTPLPQNASPALHLAKRARTDAGGSSSQSEETPRNLMTVAQMGGGLAGASATAETVDPMNFVTQSPSRYATGTNGTQAPAPVVMGTRDDPMAIDSSRSEQSSSDDDDDDIPARVG